MILWLDFETWSSVQINRGTARYMEGAQPLIVAYAVEDGPVKIHDFTTDGMLNMPKEFQDKITRVVAHHATFDRTMANVGTNWKIPFEKWYCTMAQAQSHSLPGSLGPLCKVLGVAKDKAKDDDGKRLIKLFCGPNNPFPTPEWRQANKLEAEWEKFKEYAGLDIEAMRECYRLMPNWNYRGKEFRGWQNDQEINDRGFNIDVPFVKAAVDACEVERVRLAGQAWDATDGVVESATQRDKLLTYLCEVQGLVLPNLRSSTLEEILNDDTVDEATKELLRIRLESSRASIRKYTRLANSVSTDGRLRHTLVYCGAGRTGRWAGRLFQPHNLPRLSPDAQADVRYIIPCVTEGFADRVRIIKPLNLALSHALRGVIIASPGNRLLVGDYSAIEGRVNAWVSNEMWKTAAFRDKQDLYCRIYERAFGLAEGSINKKTHGDERQIGKVLELFGGYGGGVGACINMAAAYGVDLDMMAAAVLKNAPADAIKLGEKAWEYALKKNKTYGLSMKTYVGCDVMKVLYRQGNKSIAAMWKLIEDAVRAAIMFNDPRQRFQVGCLMIDGNKQWLRIQLPSGRFLCYAQPRVDDETNAISYMQWRNKQWLRVSTYGGKLIENIVQAISRDLMMHALLLLKDKGYKTVLHVHDEIVADNARTFGSLAEFLQLMTVLPQWAAGLPLDAEGWEGERYEKH